MNPIRTLLAATDLSASARHAAARAAVLAAESGARLVLVHVVDDRLIAGLRTLRGANGETLQERLLDEVAGALAGLASAIEKRYGVAAVVHLSTGSVLQEISGVADRFDADLLVLGARGEGFVRELLLGSTTERVLRMTTRPLLVVKQMPHESYRRVLIPVDFSDRSAVALDCARAVAPRADHAVLHAYESPFERKLHFAGLDDFEMIELRAAAEREAVARINTLVADGGGPGEAIQRIVVHGLPTRCILEQEQEQDCDLIVVGKHGSGMLEELLLGRVTKQVLALSSADVLVCDRRTP